MSFVSSMFAKASGAVTGGAKVVASGPGAWTWKGVKGAAKGTFSAGMLAMGVGHENGAGYGMGAQALYLVPGLTLPLLAFDVGEMALEYGNHNYEANRKLEMFSPVPDLFGHTSTMRQRSLHSLDRGRSSLGNEARLLR